MRFARSKQRPNTTSHLYPRKRRIYSQKVDFWNICNTCASTFWPVKMLTSVMHCVWKSGVQCLKILKALHHTNKMMNISFSEAGVYVMSMDTSKTSLVKLVLKASEFEAYTCDEPITLGLYSEVLLNVMQKVKKNTLVWSARNDAELIVSFVQNNQKTQFSIRTIAIDTDELDVPELEDDAALQVPTEVVQDWFDKMLMTKSDVRFIVSEKEFQCESTSLELGTVQYSEPIGTERVVAKAFRQAVDMRLSFYAAKSLAVFSVTGGDTCFLGLSNQQPSRIKVSLGDESYLCLYVAPKIMDD